MSRRSRWLVGMAALVPLAVGCDGRDGITGTLADYEVHLRLRADGSVRVEERAEVRFAEGEPQRFALEIPVTRIDDVAGDLAVSVDESAGEPFAVWSSATPGGGVAWTGRGTAASTRVFTLAYEARGVLAVSGARGVFIWPAVPAGPDVVERARVRLEWPEGSVPMQGPAVASDGWSASADATSVTFTAGNVPREAPPSVYVDLVLGDVTVAEPRWQADQLRARQLTPAFLAAGMFMVVVAAGILLMVRIQHPAFRPTGDAAAAGVADELVRMCAAFSAWGSPRSAAEALVSAGLVDPDRLAVGRGLRLSGFVIVVVGLIAALVARFVFDSLGTALFAVPAGLVVGGVMLLARGMRFPVWTPTGAEVGMLHSRRLGSSREP
ncbi:MAG TPA: DUF2207 domain-containing protein [Vicinamibacterales bacterium]|nr:DUF2207 domain-containing protein [Vicinamibacterales bacterium]